jgi:hypothetical protein
MNDEIKKNLVDILQAAEEIHGFVKGMDLPAYKSPLRKELLRGISRSLERL